VAGLPALADTPDAPFAASRAASLENRRLAAVEDRAEAALAVGDVAAVLGALSEAAAHHPLQERLHALLMRALHGCGRQAAALAVFDEVRRTLAEELGADPSAELAAAHLSVLRGDAHSSRHRLPVALTSFVGARRTGLMSATTCSPGPAW
jgi:DNA-binding SARP family transcriptional activator